MPTAYLPITVTITAATLASGAARESAAITVDTANFVNDYRVLVKATASAGTPAGNKALFVWIATSEDGTNWSGNATGTDAAITLDTPHPFGFGIAIPFPATTLTRAGGFSVRAACGGSLPAKFSIIVENQIGFALTACTVVCEEETG